VGEDTTFDALVRKLDSPTFVVSAAAGDDVEPTHWSCRSSTTTTETSRLASGP
jgi:hypothetical protein